MGVFAVWEVGKNIQLTIYKFLVFHLRGYLGERGIFLLVHVWLLVLSLGE